MYYKSVWIFKFNLESPAFSITTSFVSEKTGLVPKFTGFQQRAIILTQFAKVQ